MRLKDSSIWPIPGSPHMLHLGTISHGLREYFVMLCTSNQQCYIEELVPNTINYAEDVYGNFKFVEDDELARELAFFAHSKGLTDMKSRIQEMRQAGTVIFA